MSEARAEQASITTSPPLENGLYSSVHGTPEAEKERLLAMAAYNDAITLDLLGTLSLHKGATVLDIGAGTSTKLGAALNAAGMHYIAYDKMPDAISAHRAAGHEATQGTSGELDIDGRIDAYISRFCFGWQTEEERDACWQRMCTISNGSILQGVLQDYDWSVSHGPQEYKDLIDALQTGLRALGFDPNYGAQLPADLKTRIELDSDSHSISVIRNAIPIHSSQQILDIARSHALSVISGLHAMNTAVDNPEQSAMIAQKAASIQNALRILSEKAQEDPELLANATPPEIVSVVFSAALKRHLGSVAVGAHGADLPSAPFSNITGMERVRIVPSEHRQSLNARRLAAQQYIQSEHIAPNGTVITHGVRIMNELTDHAEMRHRSTTFAMQSPDGQCHTSLRFVRPNHEGVWSMPTGGLLYAQRIHDLDRTLAPFLPENKVGEVHLIVSDSGNSMDTLQLVYSAVALAKEENFDYLVFSGVVGPGKSANIFDKLYGSSKVITVNGTDEPAYVYANGPGYKPDGVLLKPYYVAVPTFFQDMKDYTESHRIGSRLPPQIRSFCQFMAAKI